MAKIPVTIRTLAANLGLSRSTVSAALRGTGRVASETNLRVREAAQRAGYQHNPLAGALMSELRRSRTRAFRGNLAALEFLERDRPDHGPFHREVLAGADERAAELGFKLEHIPVDAAKLSIARVNTILHSRGISGLLLLPSWHTPNFGSLALENYASVYTDYNLAEPSLHSVCSEPYAVMMLALERVRALGYRRPGLFIERARNERLHRRHTAAFHAFHPELETQPSVPPIVTEELSRPAFEAWFARHQPDVVLCHFSQVIEWMEGCGAKVPDTHGFVCLNLCHRAHPCTTIDLQPREIGARGMELVVAQLHSNARGIPATATRTTIPPLWVDGPTTRTIAPS